MKNWKTILVLLCVAAASAVAQRPSDAERDLEAAINKEVVQGDVKGAIGLYRKIVSRYGSREIIAKALFHLGQCHEKLGQAEARKSYERIVNDFADQKDLAAQARSRLAALGGARETGGMRVRRVFGTSDDYFSISDDDQWAAIRRGGDLYVRNLSSGKETLAAQQIGGAELSGDGRWVVYTSKAPPALWLSGSDGSSRRQIEGPVGKEVRAKAVFSRDSSAVFVFWMVPGRGELWSYPVHGGGGRKVYQSANLQVQRPIFSPDGRFLVFKSGSKGPSQPSLSVLPVDGGEPWALNTFGTAVGFTADDKLVLHRRTPFPSLWAVTLRQGQLAGEPALLSNAVTENPGAYHVSGKYYYDLYTDRSDMLSVRLDGDPPLNMGPAFDRENGQGIAPDYSADGRFLAWISPAQRTSVIIRNLANGSEKEIDTSLRRAGRVRWYPDSSALLVTGNRAGTPTQDDIGIKVDLTTGDVTNVLPQTGNADASFNPTLSPDGRYIYYKRFYPTSEKRRIQRFDITNRKEEDVYRAPAGAALRVYSISPDGRQIAVVCSEKESDGLFHWIGVAPLTGGDTRRIYRTPPGVGMRGFSALAWTADSNSILFHTMDSDSSDTLWRISLDGTPAQRLLTTGGIIGNIAVHPNGRDIVLANHVGGRELWVMEGLK